MHHLDPLGGERRIWNKKNRPENLVALCSSCHGIQHAGGNYKLSETERIVIEKSKLGHRALKKPLLKLLKLAVN